MNKDYDPANNRLARRRPADRYRGWAVAWAKLFDVFTVDGRPDIERANQQIGLLMTMIAAGADDAMKRHDGIAHAISELAVSNHERKHHGRKDFH